MLALEGEGTDLGPSAHDQVVRLMKAFVAVGRVGAPGVVFGTDAAHEAGNEAAFGDVVDHGEFFGHGHRVVQQRQGPTQNRDLDIFGAPRQRSGHDTRLRHQAIGVLVVLVDADAVKAKLIGVFELVKVAVVQLGAFFRVVVAVGQRDPG